MLVWGGTNGFPQNAGWLYDPVDDKWTAITTTGAPAARFYHTAVWTGSRMLVWGGFPYTNTGAQYDPATDSWSPITTTGAPSARRFHTAVWTGSRMLVWGGEESGTGATNTGGQYDPASDSWAPLTSIGAPSGRGHHTAVWSGLRMVVWGGNRNPSGAFDETDSGGQYDPATDSWSDLIVAGAPTARQYHTAVWMGSRMLVWGGAKGLVLNNTGARYLRLHLFMKN
jgi:N-acetylneuraminic acid mutarotase